MNTTHLLVLIVLASASFLVAMLLAINFPKEIKGNYFKFFIALVFAGTIGFVICHMSSSDSLSDISKSLEKFAGPLLLVVIFSLVGGLPFFINYKSGLPFASIAILIGSGVGSLWFDNSYWLLASIIVTAVCGFLFKRFLMKLSNNT